MKVITANRLTDGRVVYFTERHTWSERPDDAVRLSDVYADDALAVAVKDVLTVVGPYLIEVDEDAPGFKPAGRKHVREHIRETGPSAGSTHTLAQV